MRSVEPTRKARATVSTVAAAVLAMLFAQPLANEAHAKNDSPTSGKSSSARKTPSKKAGTARTRTAKAAGKKKRARRAGKKRGGSFRGHAVSKDAYRDEPLPTPSGELWLYAVNFREEIKVNIFGASAGTEDQRFDDASLAQLDHLFRCKRSKKERAVDPRLYQVLSIIADHFGQKRIDLVSGFRLQEKKTSRHFHAAAVDFHIPGVSDRKLYKFAETLDLGNMGIGIYPRAGFVHVDFRAPGEPSYRWTDRSGPRGQKKHKGKRKKRESRKSRPTS